jgi:nucleotide-binding universal stress UspA family protein
MRILVVGGGARERSDDALALAALLSELGGANIVLGAVGSGAGLARSMATLKRLAPGLEVDRRAVEDRSPGAGLIHLAEVEDVDMVVIGSTHRGPFGRASLGTTADYLIAHARRPFAVAPRGYADRDDRQLRIVGLAYDGSDEAKRAAGVAIELCVAGCTPLRVFGVREPLVAGMVPGPVGEALGGPPTATPLEIHLNELLDSLPPSIGGQKLILAGYPATALLDQGSRAADLVVFGTHGFGRLLRMVNGSVAGEVARRAPWPIVVVPPERSPRRRSKLSKEIERPVSASPSKEAR